MRGKRGLKARRGRPEHEARRAFEEWRGPQARLRLEAKRSLGARPGEARRVEGSMRGVERFFEGSRQGQKKHGFEARRGLEARR
jgi:hypothetical protein